MNLVFHNQCGYRWCYHHIYSICSSTQVCPNVQHIWDQASISSSICREWLNSSHSMCAPGYTVCKEWCKIHQDRRQGYHKGAWLKQVKLELNPKGMDLVSGKAGNGHPSIALYPVIPAQSLIILLACCTCICFSEFFTCD